MKFLNDYEFINLNDTYIQNNIPSKKCVNLDSKFRNTCKICEETRKIEENSKINMEDLKPESNLYFDYEKENEYKLTLLTNKLNKEYDAREKDIIPEKSNFIMIYCDLKYDNKNKISVSKVISLEDFKGEYHDNDYKTKISEIMNNHQVKGCRQIRGDGNCLYRSYFFQYLELIILYFSDENLGLTLLKKLFINIFDCDFREKKFIEFQKNFQDLKLGIEDAKNMCLSFLKILIKLMDKKKNKKLIYQFFIMNYAKQRVFDNYLICWLRGLYYNYLKDRCDNLFNDEVYIYQIVECYNENDDEKMKIYNKYLTDKIIKYGEEGESIVNNLFPFFFGINTKIINLTKNQKRKQLEIFEEINRHSVKGMDYFTFDDEILCKEVMSHNLTINLFRRDNHYDAIYDSKIFDMINEFEKDLNNFDFAHEFKLLMK